MSWRAWYSVLYLYMCAIAYGLGWVDAPTAGQRAWSSAVAFLAFAVFGLAPEKEKK